VIASSGSALGSKLATDVLQRFGPVLYNLYGSTEVAVASIATPADLLQAPATAGRAAFGVRVEILDAGGEPVPDGTIGRVFVGGAMRFDGYTTGGGKEERRGLLSSGDLGCFRDGLLFLEGREDDMIVSGGENVYSVEVEDALYRHPAVAEAAVFGVPDDVWGEAVHAIVVPHPGMTPTGDELRAHCRALIAGYKVPKAIEITGEPLPKSGPGKILKRVLRDRYLAAG
jgi:fatty-acyl-CoA synthase